jgi:hypothetical protein
MKALRSIWLWSALPCCAGARAQAALLSPIANMSMNAGSTRSIDVVVVDPDGGSISITAALPRSRR